MNSRFSRLLFALAVAGGVWACTGVSVQADQAGPSRPAQTAPARAPEAKPAETRAADTKAEEAKEQNLPPVLNPGQFFGPAAMGYAAAQGCPHVCTKLFCYCGCDMTDGHKCLLDCFTSLHGVDCHICQEEAMVALRMAKTDDPIATIQKTIDEAYSSKYPYHDESPALKRYRAIRKWQPTVGGSSGGGGGGHSDDGATCCGGK